MKIDFKLNHPNQIEPWNLHRPKDNRPFLVTKGEDKGGQKYLSWFMLTRGSYWIDLGSVNYCEYSEEILRKWGEEKRFRESEISDFIDSFSGGFRFIAQPLPEKLYAIVKTEGSLSNYRKKVKSWINQLPNSDVDKWLKRLPDSGIDKLDIEDYLVQFIYKRQLDRMPSIGFYRNQDKISIVWDDDNLLEEKIRIYSLLNGELEIDYVDFVDEVEDFGKRFFQAMDHQIQCVIEMKLAGVLIDKEGILEKQKEEQQEFQRRLSYLKDPEFNTNWEPIESLIDSINIQNL